MSCCAPPLLPAASAANMLTLSQVSLLVSKVQDSNNNSPGLFAGSALALKMMSSRCSLAARALPRTTVPQVGPKRCLFGAPSDAETQRLLREDENAVKARMARRWGWDLSREGPTPKSNWQWESVRAPRRHPYAVRMTSGTSSASVTPITPMPAMLSPLADTPTAAPKALNTSAASSSSGTSSLSSPLSPASNQPTTPVRTKLSWDSDSDDSCCGGSESDSSTNCGTSLRPVPVQTRLTDFWRTRRCSTSEGVVKVNPVPTRPSVRTCSV